LNRLPEQLSIALPIVCRPSGKAERILVRAGIDLGDGVAALSLNRPLI
jgi:hypothetical protein